MLYANLLLNVLYHIEIEMNIRESCLQTWTFIYKPGISLTKQDFHLQRGSLGLQRGFSGYYLPINFSLTHELLENAENERIHTSYAQEKAILECVSNGDIHALENTYYSLPTTVYGKMTSSNSKLKLLFYASIANTTLVTRYAIEGGLNEETAFSLSDVYIRKMEQCTDVDTLMKLNEQMAIEFTLRVAEAKKTPKNYYSPAISRVIDYIYHGKNKTLTLNQLASLVNLTPKYLSALFHKETGQTLTVFIHKVLIEKAQNLLAHSDYSLGEISTYLNFSSQSYFISIFKRYTGITPGQYRKMHRQISW